MQDLLKEIKQCTLCSEVLPLGPNPVVRAAVRSKIAVIGQAPGLAVHQSSKPWDDKSGERLRNWLGVSEEAFYDPELFALIPIGFCYPGKGKSGDLPPRPECAPTWHGALFDQMKELKLILLIGRYAQNYYLGEKSGKNLTELVRDYEQCGPKYFPLPHPTPRNNIWLKKHPWFSQEVLPELQKRIVHLT